jgi:hypothetical protein
MCAWDDAAAARQLQLVVDACPPADCTRTFASVLDARWAWQLRRPGRLLRTDAFAYAPQEIPDLIPVITPQYADPGQAFHHWVHRLRQGQGMPISRTAMLPRRWVVTSHTPGIRSNCRVLVGSHPTPPMPLSAIGTGSRLLAIRAKPSNTRARFGSRPRIALVWMWGRRQWESWGSGQRKSR